MEMPLLKELDVNKVQTLNVVQGFLKQVLREPASHPYPDAHVWKDQDAACQMRAYRICLEPGAGSLRLAVVGRGERVLGPGSSLALPAAHLAYWDSGCSSLSASLPQTPECRVL